MSQPSGSPFPCMPRHEEPWDICLSKIRVPWTNKMQSHLQQPLFNFSPSCHSWTAPLFPVEAIKWLLGGNTNVGGNSRWHIRRILIRIKTDVINGVALAALFESLSSWRINNAMPMQDDYKVSVTTHGKQTSGLIVRSRQLTTLAFRGAIFPDL